MKTDKTNKIQEKTLAELNNLHFELAKNDRNLAYSTYPELIYPIFLKPCIVKILMVTDGGGSFDKADFGLGELLNILSTSPGPWVRFAVTKAYRGPPIGGGGADILNFKFDIHDLNQYDEIWMFAVNASPISEMELRKISEFMDNGGGVFATGDHENLGVGICGQIPRVRSMRKWYYPTIPTPFPYGNPSPPGPIAGVDPIAPSGSGSDRLDTNQIGPESPAPDTEFIDQSDNVPQRISPRIYTAGGIWIYPFYRRYVRPHPLLCGPRGIIRVLPDHPHEGECYLPHDLDHALTFSGYTTNEYPTLPGTATRLAPEVIAWSNNANGIIDAGKQAINSKTYGAIGAYDGHLVNVGRVAVDATWHHFFNINLIGDASGSIPGSVRSQGFSHPSTPPGVYEDIQAYFRNLAVWLARPEKIDCMKWRAIWCLRWHHRIAMDLKPEYLENPNKLDFSELIRFGPQAYDVLGKIAGQCLSLRWIIDIITTINPKLDLRQLIDPWYPKPTPPIPNPPDPNPISSFYPSLMLDTILAALLYTIGHEFSEPSEDVKKKVENMKDQEFIRLAKSALDIAVTQMNKSMKQAESELKEFGEKFVNTK